MIRALLLILLWSSPALAACPTPAADQELSASTTAWMDARKPPERPEAFNICLRGSQQHTAACLRLRADQEEADAKWRTARDQAETRWIKAGEACR